MLKGITSLLSFSVIFLLLTTQAQAETITTGDQTTNINISTNTGNNTSTQVENHVSATSNTSSVTTSETTVRVEQNGKVTEFNSTGENIDYQSDDGSVTVKVDNEAKPTVAEVIVQEIDEEMLEEIKENATIVEYKDTETNGNEQELNLFFTLVKTAPTPFTAPINLGIMLAGINNLL